MRTKNFLGIKEIDFSFKPGVYVLVGRNGSGKSSFFEAIYFAFFDRGLRTSDKAPLVRKGENNANVEVEFFVGENLYKLIRRITKKKRGVTTNAVLYKLSPSDKRILETVAHKTNDVNRTVVELLNIDGELFKKTFLIPQGEVQRIIESEADLRKFVMKISGFSEKKAVLIKLINSKIEELKDEERELGIPEIRRNLETLGDEKEIKEELKDLKVELENTKREVKIVDEKLSELRIYQSAIEKENMLLKLKENEKKLKDLAEKEKKAEIVRAMEGTYKLLESIKAKLLKSKRKKENRFSELKVLSKELSEFKERIAKYGEKRKELEKVLEEKKEKLDAYKEIRDDLQELLNKKSALDERRSQIELRLNDITNKGKKVRENLEKLEKEKTNLIKKREDVLKVIEKLEKDEIEWMAWRISERLKIGDECPVCGGVIGRKKENVKFNSELYERKISEKEKLDSEIGRIEGRISELKGKRDELVKEWKSVNNELKEVERKLNKIEGEIKGKLGKVNFEGSVDEFISALKSVEKEHERFLKELEEINKRMADLNVEYSRKSERYEAIKSEIETLNKEVEEQEKIYNIEYKKFCESLKDKGITMEEFSEFLNFEIAGYQKEYEEIRAKISSLEKELEELGEFKDKLKEIEKLKERKEKLISKIDEHSKRAGVLSQKLESIHEAKKRLERFQKIAEEIQEKIKILGKIHDLLRSDRFDDFFYKSQISPIIEKANYELLNITGGEYSLELDGSGIIVKKGGVSIPVRMLSGGEKTLASLVLAMAISEFFVGEIGAFFVDEGFAALDRENREKVAEMLQNLEYHGRTVIFITHDEELSGRFRNVLYMENGEMKCLGE